MCPGTAPPVSIIVADPPGVSFQSNNFPKNSWVFAMSRQPISK
jgi:hypothetical protein